MDSRKVILFGEIIVYSDRELFLFFCDDQDKPRPMAITCDRATKAVSNLVLANIMKKINRVAQGKQLFSNRHAARPYYNPIMWLKSLPFSSQPTS